MNKEDFKIGYVGTKAADLLASEIVNGIKNKQLKPGQRLAPIRSLADQYAISFGSARLAIGRLEQLGLLHKRQGSGTYVAEPSEKQIKNQQVYLMLDMEAHVYSRLASELIGHLKKSDCLAVSMPGNFENKTDANDFMSDVWTDNQPAAIVVHWDYPGLDQAIERLRPRETKVIATFRGTRFMPHDWHSVNPDHPLAFRIATDYLIKRGHKRIGFIGHERNYRLVSKTWYDRKKSWMVQSDQIFAVGQALREANIMDGLEIFLLKRNPLSATNTLDTFSEANQSLLKDWLSSSKRPTAIVGFDHRVMAVKITLEKMGLRVPEDLEIIGVGHTPWSQAYKFPSVWEKEELAAYHIARLIQTDNKDLASVAQHILIKPELILDAEQFEKAQQAIYQTT